MHKKCPKGRNCNFLHVFRDPGDEFRYSNNDKANIREVKVKKGVPVPNEWSSPEIEKKENKIESESFVDKKNKKRKRSSSTDCKEHKKKKKKKKQKKKENKKKKSKD